MIVKRIDNKKMLRFTSDRQVQTFLNDRDMSYKYKLMEFTVYNSYDEQYKHSDDGDCYDPIRSHSVLLMLVYLLPALIRCIRVSGSG